MTGQPDTAVSRAVSAHAGVPRAEVSGLTGIRFIAASSVTVAHGAHLIITLAGSDYGPVYWLEVISGFGMTLFFVLSGFVIHYNYRFAVTRGGLGGLTRFVWVRFARLYPLFIFVVMLELILGQTLAKFMARSSDEFLDVLQALPYYLTFTQSWFYVPINDQSLVYAVGTNAALTWSISTEWFFYLSYPLIALLVLRVRQPRLTIGVAAAWCVFWIAVTLFVYAAVARMNPWLTGRFGSIAAYTAGDKQDTFLRWLLYFSPYSRIGEFILGCLIGQLYLQLQGSEPTRRERRLGGILLVVGLLSAIVMTFLMYVPHIGRFEGLRYSHIAGNIRNLNYNFGLAPSVALIIFCAARYDTVFSRALNSRPLRALGEASYSIYMIHFLVFTIISSIYGTPFPANWHNVVYITVKFLFSLGLVVVISLGLHAYIEVPARQWLRGLWLDRQRRRRPMLAYSIAAAPALAAAVVVVGLPFIVKPVPPVTSGVRVLAATYGENCGVRKGNATKFVANACNGKSSCEYIVDFKVLGDPAGGCVKNFTAEYQCAPDDRRLTKTLPAEAGLGSRLDLSCASNGAAGNSAVTPPAPVPLPSGAVVAKAEPTSGIRIQGATYGGNCGATYGNATQDVAASCNGKVECDYAVDVRHLGDPAPTCPKDFVASYSCPPGATVLRGQLPAEAGFGRVLHLNCVPPSEPAK